MFKLHAAASAAAIILGVITGVSGSALLNAAPAHADIDCTTSRSSGMSITFCRYSDPWQPATTTTCWERTGYCTTRED